MGNFSNNSGEESSTDCKTKVHLSGHVRLGRWKTTPSSLQGIYHGRSHQITPKLHLGISKPKCHISGKKCDIYCHHGFPQSIASIIWIQVNHILWTSWIATPPKNRRKSAVPLKTLYLRLPGHNEFWNETCGLLQPWTKAQSRDAWRLSINTVKNFTSVFNTFESQTCDTHRYSNAGILHESTDVIFFRPMFLSMHSLQLRVCP